MLTRLLIKNFKLFEEVDLELGDRVVLIGPNNAGKTSALQALALWDVGVKRWSEKRGSGDVPEKRPGVTINRRDLIAVPVGIVSAVRPNSKADKAGTILAMSGVAMISPVSTTSPVGPHSAMSRWTHGPRRPTSTRCTTPPPSSA